MDLSAIYPTGPSGLAVFLTVTVVIAGAAAFATGRAVARQWKPLGLLAFYVLLLTGACRFLHYALFAQPFLDLRNVVIDFAVLLAIALIGYRFARHRQITEQYPWLFTRSGLLGWKQRS
ncbi:MAG: DUF6867 family protein [Pseudomonadota bacterium]